MSAPVRLCLAHGHTRVLGAQLEARTINFALAAPHAEAVELCLFDAGGRVEVARAFMPRRTHGIWHGSLPRDAEHGPGLVYGWRVHGHWAPQEGSRFNPAKLLLDPAARDVVGDHDGDDIHLGSLPDDSGPDPRDNAPGALKARVVEDLPPPRPLAAAIDPALRVIYEAHPRGLTMAHPDVPRALRGSYAALGHPAIIAHLHRLGVTTLSLMPVAFHVDEARLLAQGLRNYWGYNPIAWSAPQSRHWSGRAGTSPREELRDAIDALHEAGIEVVLDVVYNHTGEGNERGPTLSMRGIDNRLYYHLCADHRHYENWSGCGNAVNLNEPLVLRMVMDSLRRWAGEFGVDGFRFDLAVTTARGGPQRTYSPYAPLLSALAQDPVLRERLLIAEPWDIGPGGYQLGGFPAGWLEWNDRFRDTQRRFWLHHQGGRGEFAMRIAGSSDVFQQAGRDARSSVNYITSHDGFTLRDLLSYARRHNEANGEGNRDGHAAELSVNNGVEGDGADASVSQGRARQARALLASAMLALGTPMLRAGDEFGHTQGGNNNAYCQDNAVSWLDWAAADQALCDDVAAWIALRKSSPLLRASRWWGGAPQDRRGRHHVAHCDDAGVDVEARWFDASGEEMSTRGWVEDGAGTLQIVLADRGGAERMLILVNAEARDAGFVLPGGSWVYTLGTVGGTAPGTRLDTKFTLPACSVCVARRLLPAQQGERSP